jgi:hypothetical protein
MKARVVSLLIASCLLIVILGPSAAAGPQKNGPSLHSATPAGYEVMQLKPSGQTFSVLALIECPELEGARQVAEGANAHMISADGSVIEKFPEHFSFRITASLKKTLIDGPIATLDYPDDPQQLLLKLKFRVRAYHGLDVREINPESVEMIGMPADVPYDERVYRVHMNVGQLPVSDRLVVEILSPQHEVLTHFSFSLL